jgi:hypothetical protein
VTTYATVEDVEASISSTYTLPEEEELEKLIVHDSELIDHMTLNSAAVAYDSEAEEAEESGEPIPYRDALRKAVCYQIEFWMEVGAEHDVAGLRGSLVAGRLQVHPVAKTLGPRAKRVLQTVGLFYAGVAIW